MSSTLEVTSKCKNNVIKNKYIEFLKSTGSNFYLNRDILSEISGRYAALSQPANKTPHEWQQNYTPEWHIVVSMKKKIKVQISSFSAVHALLNHNMMHYCTFEYLVVALYMEYRQECSGFDRRLSPRNAK
jgi:hypothetical protein